VVHVSNSAATFADQPVGEVLDQIREDPQLSPVEKETTLRLGKQEDRVTLYTAERGIMRRLVQHPNADISTLNLRFEDGAGKNATPEEWDGEGWVVGLKATLPVAVLQIKSRPRKNTQHAEIVADRVIGSWGDRQ
jgi:hypothetical protein